MDKDMGQANSFGLEHHKLHHVRSIYWNLSTPALVEQIILREEGMLAHNGAVIVHTGQHTGRSPNDKFIIHHQSTSDDLIWWGKVNRPLSEDHFQRLHDRLSAYFQGRDVFVQDLRVGAHPIYTLPIRVITENAWASLFARDLFIRLSPQIQKEQIPQFTILHAPGFRSVPEEDGTNSDVFIVVDFDQRLILIGGTSYAGEIKKSVFTIMNYLLPQQNVLSMHCSANVGVDGDVALFFGLSGTGKTTLSSDPSRRLIGDDEHGWGEDGVFNFEGGCYAKTIRLRAELEPLIWEATSRFGTVLENVIGDPMTRQLDFDDDSLTENTRAAYPIDFVPNHLPEGRSGHPRHIFFLTADAFGVLPPLSRLTPEQAMYYFLSGYTSKLAGTEKGLGTKPEATFSTCFGAPFLPLHPRQYAQLLGEKIQRYHAQVWLLNTGWTGGAYGVGKRISLPYTRAMIQAVLTNQLDQGLFQMDPYFGISVPRSIPGVPDQILDPRQTWPVPELYENQARDLINQFETNFEQFKEDVPPEVIEAGPSIAKLVHR